MHQRTLADTNQHNDVSEKSQNLKFLLDTVKKHNEWVVDYEHRIEKYTENKGKLFDNAMQRIDEWDEQMQVSEKIIKEFINDEVKRSRAEEF